MKNAPHEPAPGLRPGKLTPYLNGPITEARKRVRAACDVRGSMTGRIVRLVLSLTPPRFEASLVGSQPVVTIKMHNADTGPLCISGGEGDDSLSSPPSPVAPRPAEKFDLSS